MSLVLEVEADSFSDDLKSATVACPTCAKKHEHNAQPWAANEQGVFHHQTWYGATCNCGCNFAFMLEFASEPLQVGRRYLIKKPPHSFGVIENDLVNFKETVYDVEVLKKPEMVTTFDGETETIEPIPENLAGEDWYYVRSVRTNRTQWLNPKGCQRVPL